MTGRAMGRCAGYPEGGYAMTPGRGGFFGYAGRRWGGRRGYRNRFYETGLPYWRRYRDFGEPWTAPEETEDLKRQVLMVSEAVERIARRVEELIQNRKGTE
ncbi:MAG: hypothetical protein AVO35_08505 [Candidatus Aegiribacteria sp. MLS_C]|nr:MAG: hypothetical protein AVO35_08505 [Candidatus Aegiribacteria sp. MLS_C]